MEAANASLARPKGSDDFQSGAIACLKAVEFLLQDEPIENVLDYLWTFFDPHDPR